MPIRRLFGLLVCVLSLLSAPAVAQTVAFVHGDADTSAYLEETEARVRVTDPAADASPYVLDEVQVTLTTSLSGDSEVLALRETDRDSGVFEGRIKLARNATPSQAGILETGFTAGPPTVFDTLTAQYGAATDTAEMAAVRIQLLDEYGRRATALTHGDWVHVRLEDHVRAGDPWLRDTVSVLVQNPDMGDSELLTLTETALRTGVFEGRLRHLTPLSPSGDGVIGGYPFHQILAAYDVPGYPEDAEASATVVGSRVEVLGADGRPTSLVPESSPLRLRVTNRAAAESPGIETVDVELHSQITGDDETVLLTETGPATGIFEGTVPTTVFGPAQDDDGTLTTGELLGPPHSFDVVQISYTDDLSGSGTVWTSVGTYASETRFTDAEGRDAEAYAAGFPAWVRVEDHNANQPSVVDTIQATVQSLAQGDSEALLLTETGQDTGVFSGSIAVELPAGGGPGDGRLEAQEDEQIRALHGDALGYTASGDLARVRSTHLEFIDEDGRRVDVVVENGTARVRLEWSACNGSPVSIDLCTVSFTTLLHGDQESIPVAETGNDTGVFTGWIRAPLAFSATPYNGALEIGNSGSPEYRPDEITASAGPNSATVATAGFTLRFVHVGGEDAESFAAGEAVGLRLEDGTGNDPYTQQTETLQVRVFASPETETVQLTETGADTGIYLGSVPSRLGASPSPSDGTLDVEVGSRLLVDRPSASDPREVRDEAVVSGAAAPADSPVRFVDAWGNPTDSYVAGSTAYVRVVDGEANLMPGSYDTVQVTVSAPGSGDSETANLLETARDSGIFEGSVPLSALQAGPGDLITAAYAGGSDQATIRYAAAMFVDEAGVPTGEVPEGGVARLRVVGTSAGSTIEATVRSEEGADVENVTLAETFSGSQVYEGTVQLAFGPRGDGTPQNGVLETANSGAPAYRGDELTLSYQDGEGTAVTVPSRAWFVDGYGRTTTSFAVGEAVAVRVEDHNLDNPFYKEQIQVLVREAGLAYSQPLDLVETGYDTNVYEGSLPDGTLPLQPGQTIEAERLNENTPNPTVARATIAGASVTFVDAQGRPASLFFERTRAYVRVVDQYADLGSSIDMVTVSLSSALGLDSESLGLFETGGSTGVFEGYILLTTGGASPDNGYLEVGQYAGPPHEFDTLTASYASANGTATATAGTLASRTWFLDSWGNETDGYTAGTTAFVRVEDHVANAMAEQYDTVQVTLSAPETGDSETVSLRETTRDSGIFEGSVRLEKEDYPPVPNPGDGRLQSMPAEEIAAVHDDWGDGSSSSDTAVIRYSTATFVDEAGDPTGEVLENGVARLRVESSSPGPTVGASVRSLFGGDVENVTLAETFPGSQIYEGTLQLSFVPRGNAAPQNGVLDAANSGMPEYLGDQLTLEYQDGRGTAVTIPSRVRFFDGFGRVVTTFAVGEWVGVRVEDHNLDNPLVRSTMDVLVHEVGAGDSESVTLTETGYDTNVYEGSLASENVLQNLGDGKLQVQPGRRIAAERLNQNTPYPTVSQAAMAGASIVFLDEQGRPAELYFERTRAYVRVTNKAADYNSYPDLVQVTLTSILGGDGEFLNLSETGGSTGVFEGSIPLTLSATLPYNGYLETGQYVGPPHEFDTLTASYETDAGTVTATAGTIGARTWFLDAWGNDTDSYTAGTRAYVRVKAPNANAMQSVYDTVQVALSAPQTGDSETLTLRETARDSGIFEGSLPLEKEDYPPVPVPGDGRLQSLAGEEIEVVHTGWDGNSTSSDTAVIRFSSAMFVDGAGEPTGEVPESGVARLRVLGSSPGSTVVASVRSLYGGDVENVTLAEISPGSQVYEGTLQLSFVPPGSGTAQNGVLDASNSSMPEYLGDELSVEYQDGRGTAVTVPSRVRFFDGFGRLTTTFAVGERVGVRVEDHNVDSPLVREQIQVTVREAGSADSEAVTLTETGFDTNVYEGGLASEDAPANFGDGKLQVQPGDAIEAERLNEHSPYPTVGRAVMAGAAIVFLDAQGQPAELYFERTRAHVRVTDRTANYNPYADMVTVFLSSMLALDGESLTLVETGGSTGVFEGSIPLSTNPPSSHNGILETGQFSGPPHEFDTLTASYSSGDETVSDTAGMIGSRVWFLDAFGNDVESYTAGTAAWLRVEDHVANSIDSYRDTIEVTVQAPDSGDSELVTLRETTWTSGIFEGSLPLEKEDYPPLPAPGDGRLQSMPGEEIEAVYQDYSGDAVATDSAVIRYSSAAFIDEAGEPTGEVLEAGVARLRATGSTPGPTVVASVRSLRGGDVENVTLAETFSGSQVYEGTVQLSFVPPGNAIPQNGVLDAANSGMPDYLGDQLTVEYQDGRGTAVTVPSRVRFFDAYGRLATAFAAGERVGVRVEDHNDDNPLVKGQIQVLVREAGAGDSQSLTLTETGYDTNVYEGGLDTENAAAVPGDGRLQVLPGGTIEAERLNENSPYPTVARAAVTRSAVLFVDEQGRPAELYFERTRAWVRVIDEAADLTPLPETFSVSLTSLLAPDFEDLYLTETGGSTGVFEGSIPLSTNPASSFNGALETGQRVGPPHEFDTLTVTHRSVSGTAGTIGSRTWFVDSRRNPTDAYPTGSSASFLVEDHTASSVTQVTLRSLATGDVETRTVNEGILGSGIFDGYIELQTSSTPAPGDSRLQAVPGEEIEVTHADWAGNSSSSDRAAIRQAGVEVFEDGQAEYGLVLENGVARIRVIDTSGVTGAGVTVRTRDGQDSENVSLSQTAIGWLEGTIELSFVPRGGGIPDNGTLETSNSGMPEYLQDEITVTYLDAESRAVTVPSRIGFLSFAEDQRVTEYAVGSTIRVRVEDRNANDPVQVDATTALLSAAGDFESVTLTETAADSGIFLGELPSSDAPGAAQDGTLTAGLNTVATVEHLNVHTPHPTRVPLPFNGNFAPQAGNDAVQTEQAPVVIDVLANDTDRDQDPLGISWFWQGANGSVSIESDRLRYTPDPGFLGTDTFHYVASDARGGESKGTVTVTVVQANRPPEAAGDSATVQEDGPPAAIDVLANDVDPDGDPLAVTILTPPAFGTATVQPDRTVLFTPNPNAYGSDGFTYQIEDPAGATSSATVLVGITGVNDPPAANDDAATAAEDGSVNVTVLANDTDVENDALDVTAVTQGANGGVILNADDTVTYTPNASFNGTDSFTYTVSDGNGGLDSATVTVTVTPVNDAPVAGDDTAAVIEDGSVTVNVLGNDSDADNDTLTVTAVTQGANGTVTLDPVTYTPNANYNGTDSFTYTVSDGNGGEDTATVTVTVTAVNDAPVANDDPASVAEDGSVTVAVLANDTDAENDTLTVTAVTQGTHGTVTLDPVTYTPNPNFNGADSFTYTISDGTGGGGGTDTATVNVTVGAANDAPVANDDTATVAEDGSVLVSVLGNDTDLDNDTLTVTAVTQGANGAVTLNPVTYTPNPSFFGSDSFTYTISDGNGGTDVATVAVTVTAVNDAPVAVDDTATTLAETPVTIQVRTNDTDVEGATLTITAVTQGAHGTVAIDAGQTVTYTPAAAWIGPDTFTYTISDGAGGTATATVNVTVQAPPRVSANIQVLYAFNEGSGTTVNDTSGVGTPLNLTVANASAVTWLPGALSIDSNTLVQSAGAATKVINACKWSNEVTVEAWVLPANLTQTGPAAIVTISQNHTKRDITLGQSGTAYNGQLRTSTTGQGGTQHSAAGVASLDLTHVVYTRSSTGAVRIYVNGTQAATGTLTGNLSTWASFELALGGELSGTRYWTGDLHLVAIYSRALTAAEVRQNFLAGAD